MSEHALFQIVGRRNIEQVDIVVGIPSLLEAENITYVAELAAEGLRRYFPDLASVLVNVDNHSSDDTRSAFLAARTGSIPRAYLSTPEGVTGRGNNLHNLFQRAREWNARAVVVLDADLKSLRPVWIRDLVRPVLDGFDFVLPTYARSEYDGTITNHFVYPLLRSVFGVDARQPMAGDCAFSPRLIDHWLKQEWTPEVHHYGVDIFMLVHALLGDFRVAQAELGVKMHRPTCKQYDSVFRESAETLFELIAENRDEWSRNYPLKVVHHFGSARFSWPQAFPIDYRSIRNAVLGGYRGTRSGISQVLSSETWEAVDECLSASRMEISNELWNRIVFEYLSAWIRGVREETPSNRAIFFSQLRILLQARTASFILETLDGNWTESERRIRQNADLFAKERETLLTSIEDGPAEVRRESFSSVTA